MCLEGTQTWWASNNSGVSEHFILKSSWSKEDGEGNGNPLQYFCLENPWTEESGRLQSMGSRGVGHDWATSLSLSTFMRWRRKWQLTPVFLPGESQGWQSLVGCRLWVSQSRTQLKRLSSSSSSSHYKSETYSA